MPLKFTLASATYLFVTYVVMQSTYGILPQSISQFLSTSHQLQVTVPTSTTDIELLPFPDNKAHLLHSCKIVPSRADILKASFHSMTDNISYVHVFKCGGTLVQNVLTTLHEQRHIANLHTPGREARHYHLLFARERLFDLGDEDLMLFSYIRDPVERFISAFYEVKRRQTLDLFYNAADNDTEADLSGMRWILNEMQTLKRENNFAWSLENPASWSMDQHFRPQMHFLTDSYGAPFRFNYIGQVDNISVTLPQILQKYQGISPEIVNETMDHVLHDGSRSRKFDEGYVDKQYVTRDDLSSEDLRLIRQLYWMDYDCLFPEL